jgi:hypothetical protein
MKKKLRAPEWFRNNILLLIIFLLPFLFALRSSPALISAENLFAKKYNVNIAVRYFDTIPPPSKAQRLVMRKYFYDDAVLFAERISADYTSFAYPYLYGEWKDSLYIPKKYLDSLADVIYVCWNALPAAEKLYPPLMENIDPAIIDTSKEGKQNFNYTFVFDDINMVSWKTALLAGEWKTGKKRSDQLLASLGLSVDTGSIEMNSDFNCASRAHCTVIVTSNKPLNTYLLQNKLFKLGTYVKIYHRFKQAPALVVAAYRTPSTAALFINNLHIFSLSQVEQTGNVFLIDADYSVIMIVPQKLYKFRPSDFNYKKRYAEQIKFSSKMKKHFCWDFDE